MKTVYNIFTRNFVGIFFVTFFLFTVFAIINPIRATNFTQISDTMSGTSSGSPQGINATAITHKISFIATTAITASTGTITLYVQTNNTNAGACSCGFTSRTAPSTITDNGVAVTGSPVFGSEVTTQTVAALANYTFSTYTITLGTSGITAGHTVAISGFTLTNPTTASSATNQYLFYISSNSGDIGTMAVPINTTSAVSVTAQVLPTITFALSSSSIALGVLTTSGVASQTNTLTLNTNAGAGATISVYDANGGLLNAQATKTITSATATLAAGTEGFGINASNVTTTGSTTVQSPFASGGASVGAIPPGGGSAVTLATTTAGVAGSVTTVTYQAAINSTTPAGNYTDTITYVASGKF